MCLSIEVARPSDVLAKGQHSGFEWVVVHNGMGFRCGYVRLPKGHPWHGCGYDLHVEVHGGITFAEPDVPCDKPGDDGAWWIGFDCAHGGDAQDPALPKDFDYKMYPLATVRTQAYVESECRSLCEQASFAANNEVSSADHDHEKA